MSWQDDLKDAIASIPLSLDRMRSELSVGLGEFQNGIRLRGARNIPVGTGVRQLAYAGTGRLVGWSLRATDAITVTVHDGRDASGDTLAVLDLAAGTDTQWFGPGGISFVEGLYVDIDGDAELTGSVWVGAVD